MQLFNVPLYIQVTGSVENKGGKCFYENNFKANDCFFLSLAMIISVACSTAVAAETLEDQNVTSHRVSYIIYKEDGTVKETGTLAQSSK